MEYRSLKISIEKSESVKDNTNELFSFDDRMDYQSLKMAFEKLQSVKDNTNELLSFDRTQVRKLYVNTRTEVHAVKILIQEQNQIKDSVKEATNLYNNLFIERETVFSNEQIQLRNKVSQLYSMEEKAYDLIKVLNQKLARNSEIEEEFLQYEIPKKKILIEESWKEIQDFYERVIYEPGELRLDPIEDDSFEETPTLEYEDIVLEPLEVSHKKGFLSRIFG